MPILASAGSAGTKDFQPAPAGVHQAVCVDVVDLGVVEVTYPGTPPKKQHKVRLVWQIDELMDSGKPFIASKRYTLSLHEKASLRADLESWRGKPFSESELAGFDLEVLIGINCLLNILRVEKSGTTYANISAVMPLKRGMAPIVASKDYVRSKDRTGEPLTHGEPPADDPFGSDLAPF